MFFLVISIIGAAGIGILCARFIRSVWLGLLSALLVPGILLLLYLLLAEYILPYRGGGASMWPIALVVGGTLFGFTGMVFYFLSKGYFVRKKTDNNPSETQDDEK